MSQNESSEIVYKKKQRVSKIFDGSAPTYHCPKCQESEFTNTYELEGKRCPYCKNGSFSPDPEHRRIS